MKKSHLISLLHLCDPTLPIGGYAHSYGLETYVLHGKVNSVQTAKEFIFNSLNYNLKFNDALYVRLAWEATLEGNFQRVAMLDQECSALKSPQEIRGASLKLGTRLLKIFNPHLKGEGVERLEQLTKGENRGGHFPVIYGSIAALLDIPLEETLLSFYYNSLVCMVTNSVKLIPLGQLSGQDILFELEEGLDKLVDETILLDDDMRAICAVGFDIKAMQHERLYSRLYMS